MKKLFLFALMLTVLLFVVSCGDEKVQNVTDTDSGKATETVNSDTSEADTKNDIETEEIEDSVAMKMETFTIDGVDIKDFKLKVLYVYNSHKTPREFEQVHDFNALMLDTYLGYELEIHEGDMVEGEHYIIFDEGNIAYTDYSIEIENGNLYIRGSHTAINTAIDTFYKMLNRSKGNLALTAADNVSGKIEYPEMLINDKEELRTVLEYLQEDDSFIFGQHLAGSFIPSWWIDEYTEAVGEGPGMITVELLWYRGMNDGQKSMLLSETIDYAAKGGLVSIMHHWVNPAIEDSATTLDYAGKFTPDQWKEIVTKGTELNRIWHEDLDACADFIGMLKDAGVSVIFRPMIEGNGGWFWWGCQSTEGTVPKKDMVAVWRYVHDYFTKDLGLDNILWSYDPNITNEYTYVPYDYYYPGDNYCDIVGIDWYTTGTYEIGDQDNDWGVMLDLRKPTCLAEFGVTGNKRAADEKPETQITLWNCEDYVRDLERMVSEGKSLAFVAAYRGVHGGPAFVGKGEALANCQYIVSLEEMPDLIKKILK